jgi:ribosomal protein S18 acetylase RimI-like enzyme
MAAAERDKPGLASDGTVGGIPGHAAVPFVDRKDRHAMKVMEISRELIGEAADVLARAFAEGPLFAYFLPPGAPNRAVHLRGLCRLECQTRLELGFPPLGCLHHGELVGVACVVKPGDTPRSTSLMSAALSFEASVGPDVMRRIREYGRISGRLKPVCPHLYLQMLGVVPEAQGQGFGRALLDAVQAMSEANPPSEGVALDTGNPANLALYAHMGYAVRGRAKLGTCDVWSMFRPNGTKH